MAFKTELFHEVDMDKVDDATRMYQYITKDVGIKILSNFIEGLNSLDFLDYAILKGVACVKIQVEDKSIDRLDFLVKDAEQAKRVADEMQKYNGVFKDANGLSGVTVSQHGDIYVVKFTQRGTLKTVMVTLAPGELEGTHVRLMKKVYILRKEASFALMLKVLWWEKRYLSIEYLELFREYMDRIRSGKVELNAQEVLDEARKLGVTLQSISPFTDEEILRMRQAYKRAFPRKGDEGFVDCMSELIDFTNKIFLVSSNGKIDPETFKHMVAIKEAPLATPIMSGNLSHNSCLFYHSLIKEPKMIEIVTQKKGLDSLEILRYKFVYKENPPSNRILFERHTTKFRIQSIQDALLDTAVIAQENSDSDEAYNMVEAFAQMLAVFGRDKTKKYTDFLEDNGISVMAIHEWMEDAKGVLDIG